MLSACGFEPMYGGTTRNSYGATASEDKLSKIHIANVPNAEGQYLRNALMDRLYRHGRPADALYTLNIDPLQERLINLDITIESETTRRQITIKTSFTLIDNQSKETLLSRSVSASNSYNILGSQFTTLVSKEDAREAVLNDIARQIEGQLALYMNR
jgi:LPS-assembly lipoprotein